MLVDWTEFLSMQWVGKMELQRVDVAVDRKVATTAMYAVRNA